VHQCPTCGKQLDPGTRFCPDDGTPLTETAAPNVKTPATPRSAKKETLQLPVSVGNRYRLVEFRGGGGMARVYRAIDTTLEREVAVKLINPDLRAEPEFDARFQREARIASQLADPHIVVVHDFGLDANLGPYLVMEYLQGQTLRERLQTEGKLPFRAAVQLSAQLMLALIHAHNKNIVHRDIKPDNIFLAQSNDDEAYVVKILDFGVAKMGTGPNEQGSQGATRTGAVLGTPLYMSPEQARGLKTIDHRTDLYSLGLVAYTMFTGNLAFSSESFGDLLLQICTAPLPQLCAGAPWLPPTMEAWFARACARDPQDRYASAQEFADALRAAAGATMQGRGPSQSGLSSQGFRGESALNPHALASSGTSSGISRTGEVFVPETGRRQIGIAVAIVSLLVGGAIVAAVIAFGRGSTGAAHPAVPMTPTATTQAPVATATAIATPIATDRLPALEGSSTAGTTTPVATTAPTHSPALPPPPQHGGAAHTPATHANPPGSPAAAATVDLGY
jgi:serine/threonine protein kinase